MANTKGKAEMAITRARTVLLVGNPFYGVLSLQLELVEVPDGPSQDHRLHRRSRAESRPSPGSHRSVLERGGQGDARLSRAQGVVAAAGAEMGL